jgi:hypothetical protein
MDDIEPPSSQGAADGPRHRWIGYRHSVRMIAVGIQQRQPMGQWMHVVNLDTPIEDGTFVGRCLRRRDDLDVMTPIGQNVRQVPDVDLLPPDVKRRVELRQHQDAHSRVQSCVARSWSTQSSQLLRLEG